MSMTLNKPKLDNLASEIWKSAVRLRGKFKAYEYQTAELPLDRKPYLKRGEIIVIRSGAYTGDSAIIPSALEGAITGYDMVATVTRASPHFVAYSLLSKYVLEDQIHLLTLRAAQPHLNAEELGSVVLALPTSHPEQVLERQIETLVAYRKSLIHECVTGERRVTDADLQRARSGEHPPQEATLLSAGKT